jgi:membrane associated rhomboid family serine protease
MIRLTFFPYFALYSFTFFYLVLITFVFCYSLSWHTEEYDNPHMIETEFLKVSQKALFELGENYPYYVLRKYHYYRLLTCMVLFRNFYHFVLCAVGIVVLGSYIEAYL